MEAVAEERDPLEANKEFGLEDDPVSTTQEEEFDFDIGGPGDNLEETLDGLESNHYGVTYHTENHDATHDVRTYLTQDHGAQEVTDDSHKEELPSQDQGQHDLEVSAFDSLGDAEGVDQADQLDEEQGDHTERDETQQADDAQYGEVEQYQEDVYLEDTAEELGGLADAEQQSEDPTQGDTGATSGVELSHLEDEHLNDDIRDEGIRAEEMGVAQSGDERQPLVDSSYVDETAENGTTVAETQSKEVTQSTSLEPDTSVEDIAPRQNTTGTAYDLDNANDQEAESFKGTEQHPRVRVSYGAAEFYLFAESSDADPDDYFFEDADVLSQPLSQFLSKLRQVVTEDLQDLDEVFVKVDGLGLEFGEATTKDFLERTTFGQVLELYDRLVKLDDDSSEVPELYMYLETRPNCLHRLTELTNNADQGKGLSHVAFYYEGTPDFAAIEEASNDYDQGHQDMVDSDDISANGSNDQVEGGLSATHEIEQTYNPFRLSESQQQAMEASNSGVAEEEVADDPMSADADEAHAAYDDENDESFSGEMHEHLELMGTETSHDVSATGAQQDSDLLPGEDEDVAADVANDEYEVQHYVEEDLPVREEATGTEANAETENEDLQDADGPTDGENLSSFEISGCTASSEICACAYCMSTQPTSLDTVGQSGATVESELKSRDPHRQLLENALADVHQALVTTADWSSNFSSTFTARDSLVANFHKSNHLENTPADFNVQDYDTAENDDYLDIGATEEGPAESVEYAASAGTPEPTSNDSSATATLDGEGQVHGDDVSATEAVADADHSIQTLLQPEPGPPETPTDEIHWNDDDEHDNDSDEVDITNQNQTDLSPSSLSVKRGRQADEDDVGLGDDSSRSSCGVESRTSANTAPVAKRRRT